MIWTSLADVFDAATILEIYRLRWHIELVFKRMKAIMGLGHLPRQIRTVLVHGSTASYLSHYSWKE